MSTPTDDTRKKTSSQQWYQENIVDAMKLAKSPCCKAPVEDAGTCSNGCCDKWRKARTIDAIHALLATLGEPPSVAAVDPVAGSHPSGPRASVSASAAVTPEGRQEVKRYDLVTRYRCGSAIEEMERADDGEWVRYEDVIAEGRQDSPVTEGEPSG